MFADHIAEGVGEHPETVPRGLLPEAVGRVILFRSLERLVSAQPWYSGGYRANVVAYAMAKLAKMIREQEPSHGRLERERHLERRLSLAGY